MTASGDPRTPDPGVPGPGDDTTLTVEDIGGLNRQMVLRAAVFARLAGTVLVAAGVVGLLAWAWMTVRVQQQAEGEPTIDPLGSGTTTGDIAFIERVDLLAAQVSVGIIAVLAVGLGLGVRLVADYTVARTGGSLTGYEPGDQV